MLNITFFTYLHNKKQQERKDKLLNYKRPCQPNRSAIMVSHTTLKAVPLRTLQDHRLLYLPPSHCTGSHLVTEKQLMTVARAIGRCWREIGRLALGIHSVKLEQIEEDHILHVERVFAMLRYWRIRQREKATAAHLHSLLSREDWALPPERIDFLLDTD